MSAEKIIVVVSKSLETGRRYLEVVECITEPKEDIIKRVAEFDAEKRYGKTWKAIENVDPELALVLLQVKEAERESVRQTRQDIRDYFREAREAIDELENIYNEKY